MILMLLRRLPLPTLRPPTAHPLSFRPLQMSRRNPALIVRSSARRSRAISAYHTHLITRIDLLRTTARALGPLTTLAAAALLRKECGDPGIIDEEAGPSEGGGEEDVEEDATRKVLAGV